MEMGRGTTMTIHTVRTRTDIFTDDQGRDFELPFCGETGGFEPIVSELADGRVLVSYLLVDEDSEHMDPRQSDGSGWQEFRVLYSQSDADELSGLFDCESCGYGYGDHLLDGEMRTDLDTWIGCDGWKEPPASVAIREGRAFLFEKYEHGLVNYALRGESSQVDRQWDVSPVAGFIWADDDWGEDVDIEEAARAALQEFTDWCNGNVWGIVHAFYTDRQGLGWTLLGDETEACWGFIGDEYAESELKSEHQGYIDMEVK